MARPMTPAELDECWAEYMRLNGELQDYTSPEGRDAMQNLDQWVSDHTAEMNQTLPLPYRSVATNEDKAQILVQIIRFRWIKEVN